MVMLASDAFCVHGQVHSQVHSHVSQADTQSTASTMLLLDHTATDPAVPSSNMPVFAGCVVVFLWVCSWHRTCNQISTSLLASCK